MSNLTISQIAREWKISRTTIYKKLDNGELSQNEDKTIFIGEVIRVFGEPWTKEIQNEQVKKNNYEQPLTDIFFNIKIELEKEKTINEQLKEQLKEYKQRVQYLENTLNKTLESVQELSQIRFLLEQPKQKEPEKRKKFLWIF